MSSPRSHFAPAASLLRRLVTNLAVVLLPTLLLAFVVESAARLLQLDQRVARYVSRKLYPTDSAAANLMFATRQYDPILSWRLRPNSWLPGNIGWINSMGFVGPERSRHKPPDTLRILSLGDSVTYGAWGCGLPALCRTNPYPEALETLLWPALRQSNVEVINAGVYGYTSLQGLRYFRTYLGDLDADVVTLMFGWNDHGLARGADAAEPRLPAWRWLAANAAGLSSFRAGLGLLTLAAPPVEQAFAPGGYRPRVTIEQFEDNLVSLVRLIQHRGALVVLLTEPVGPLTALIERHEGLQMWGMNQLPDAATWLHLHAQYNDTVRRVAAQRAVALVDVDRTFSQRDVSALFDPHDMIHPNEAGHRVIAEMLRQVLAQRGVVGG